MKLAKALLVASCHYWGIAHSSLTEDVVAECGTLGVMMVGNSLPANVDLGAVRKCAEHPLAAFLSPIGKRDCWYGKSSGCSNNYCWKSCGGRGQWCWTAFNDGYGDWIGCSNDDQCNTKQACGIGNCKSCGCSC